MSGGWLVPRSVHRYRFVQLTNVDLRRNASNGTSETYLDGSMLPFMSSPNPGGEREKLISKLPAFLQQALKVRAAQLQTDMQDAVTAGIQSWRSCTDQLPTINTAGAASFGTFLPEGLYDA